jgi:hypothetical protein
MGGVDRFTRKIRMNPRTMETVMMASMDLSWRKPGVAGHAVPVVGREGV